jgi:pyridoxamine 5'-phosphate oxidase family protein
MPLDLAPVERAYLESQRLGRLATVAADGQPQNNPVGPRLWRTGAVPYAGYSRQAIRIHPIRVISWGLEEDEPSA